MSPWIEYLFCAMAGAAAWGFWNDLWAPGPYLVTYIEDEAKS